MNKGACTGLSGAYRALVNEETEIQRKKEAEFFGPLEDSHRAYRLTGFVRDFVQRLASTEVYPDAPLTSAQVESVTDILRANAPRRTPNESWQIRPFGTINWDAAGRQLQDVVSPSQQATLREFIKPWEVDAQRVERSLLLFRAQAEGKPPQ